jgi:hypothetical protein
MSRRLRRALVVSSVSVGLFTGALSTRLAPKRAAAANFCLQCLLVGGASGSGIIPNPNELNISAVWVARAVGFSSPSCGAACGPHPLPGIPSPTVQEEQYAVSVVSSGSFVNRVYHGLGVAHFSLISSGACPCSWSSSVSVAAVGPAITVVSTAGSTVLMQFAILASGINGAIEAVTPS